MAEEQIKVNDPDNNNSPEVINAANEYNAATDAVNKIIEENEGTAYELWDCLLYTSPSPRDLSTSRMPSSA